MASDKKLAVFVREGRFLSDSRYAGLELGLEDLGYSLYPVRTSGDILPGTEMILSVGGDGTFLSAATVAGGSGIPVLGVNFGRLGFLSENRPEDMPDAIKSPEDGTASLVDIAWYGLNGMRVDEPSCPGFYIKVERWSDGRRSVTKILIR